MKYFILLIVMIIGFSGIAIATPVSFFEGNGSVFRHFDPALTMLLFGIGLICLAGLGKKYLKKEPQDSNSTQEVAQSH